MGSPARHSDSDDDLVCAVQGGDPDAFGVLFTRHYPAVSKACARRLGNTEEADEVAQAAFVRAFERIGQCRGERRFGAWVQVIARHLCIDHRRARARVVPHEAPLSDDLSDGARPEDPLLEREQRDQVHRAIAELPERQRRALTARVLGHRPGEIAATLGLSIGAVDSLLLRARRRLAVTYTSAASEGTGAVVAATGTSTTASLGSALAADPGHVADGMTAAASQVVSAVGSLPGVRPAGGLVTAVVSAALTFGGGGPGGVAAPGPVGPSPVVPEAPATVVADPVAASLPSGTLVVVTGGDGSVTVTIPPVPAAAAATGGRAGPGGPAPAPEDATEPRDAPPPAELPVPPVPALAAVSEALAPVTDAPAGPADPSPPSGGGLVADPPAALPLPIDLPALPTPDLPLLPSPAADPPAGSPASRPPP